MTFCDLGKDFSVSAVDRKHEEVEILNYNFRGHGVLASDSPMSNFLPLNSPLFSSSNLIFHLLRKINFSQFRMAL